MQKKWFKPMLSLALVLLSSVVLTACKIDDDKAARHEAVNLIYNTYPEVQVMGVQQTRWQGLYLVVTSNGNFWVDVKEAYAIVGRQVYLKTSAILDGVSKAAALPKAKTVSTPSHLSLPDQANFGQGFAFKPSTQAPLKTSKEVFQVAVNELLPQLPSDYVVRFPAQGQAKHTLSVFTDFTCPYCKRLHEQLPALNAAGIAVDYYLFPRQGPQSKNAQEMRSALCSSNPKFAVDSLFMGRKAKFDERDNCQIDMQKLYDIGLALELKGTPYIIADNGMRSTGFSSVEKLQQSLKLED